MNKIELVDMQNKLLNWEKTIMGNHELKLEMADTWKLFSLLRSIRELVEENLKGGE